jgi:hypothetical protein
MSDWMYDKICEYPRLAEILTRLSTRFKHQAEKYAQHSGATTYMVDDYLLAAIEGVTEYFLEKELKGHPCNQSYYYNKGISEMAHLARRDRQIKSAEKGFAQRQNLSTNE